MACGAGEMAFLFPFEERRDIRAAEEAGGSFCCKGMEWEGELISILDDSAQFIYQKPHNKNINFG